MVTWDIDGGVFDGSAKGRLQKGGPQKGGVIER